MKAKRLNNWSIPAIAMSVAFIAGPMHVNAQDQLPDLEGTTYGVMLNQLQTQVTQLEGADAAQREQVLHETTRLLAEQNQVMIRMIDALHDKVNGLLRDEQSLVQAGETKFDDIGAFVGGR